MGSILTSILAGGNELKFIDTKFIDNFLRQYSIQNYKINTDGTVLVMGNVDFKQKLIINIKGNFMLSIKFSLVSGDFNISNTSIVVLKGCPTVVGGSFICNFNNLKTLNYSPRSVGGDYVCNKNITKFTKNNVRSVCKVGGDIYV